MVRRLLGIVAVCSALVGMAYAGASSKSRTTRPVKFTDKPQDSDIQRRPAQPPNLSPSSRTVGTSTTLTGFYDYQTNGPAPQYIRVDPATGDIHVTYMLSDDSASVSPSRGVGYALSTDGGVTWDNFGNVRVPNRRAGFVTLDLMQGPFAGLPILADHTQVTGDQSVVSIGNPPGTFVELPPPPLLQASGADEPIWPFAASPSDGSIVIHSSRNETVPEENYITRTSDFITWADWLLYPHSPIENGGRNPTKANATGRVGILSNAWDTGGVTFLESTDNGITWPDSPVEIYPPFRVADGETLAVWTNSDMVYSGDDALFALNSTNYDTSSGHFFRGSQIEFWSAATGLVTAVAHDTTLHLGSMNGQAQLLSVGGPAIGMSGSRIVIVYMVFQPDTAASGFNFADVWYTQSADGGATWATPINITNTPNLDERYPGISPWNEDGFANIVWQEDVEPGAHAFNDSAPVSRSSLIFLNLELPPIVPTSVPGEAGIAASFKLDQNYPNPFNPSTNIRYSIPAKSLVTLKVFNVLGQEVATLVNSEQEAGSYVADFDAAELSSGVYLYKLQAGSFTETKKMMLVK